MATFKFSTQQFRSLPSPTNTSRVGLFFTLAANVPRELWDWREVNPREVNQRSAVYKSISQTLTQEPARFHERNRGITLVAKELTYDEKRKEVILKFDDRRLHGVVDGAHTLDAILEAQAQPPEDGWPAHVFIKTFVGLDSDQIAEIAGGLNTSQQVDLKSLENLREHFEELKRVLANESYANAIAYKMNEEKPVDVREVLYYLAVFDRSEYSDKNHPVALFGRKEGIVRRFAEQAADKSNGDSFRTLIAHAPEILRLRDMIEKRALEVPSIGRYKAGKRVRVRSKTNHKNHLNFLNEHVDGKIPLGWIMPMLAGFRANVEWHTRGKNTFAWTVPLDELLDSCIQQLVLGIQDVHDQENSRPEFVGRNSIAWRMSYNTVSQAILEWQLRRARKS
ncbi:MAG: AIPR family protein [Candidatus Hydrogenedentes bacterium]|nr:AIPR family protein [Candidatus Hydrogenedentota bacterium]